MWIANLAVFCLVLVSQSYSTLHLKGARYKSHRSNRIDLLCSNDGWRPKFLYYWKLNNTIVLKTVLFRALYKDLQFIDKVRVYTGWNDHYVYIQESSSMSDSYKWQCGDDDDDDDGDWSNEICLPGGTPSGKVTELMMTVSGNLTFTVQPSTGIVEGSNFTMSCRLDAENATLLSQSEDFEMVWIRNDTMFAVTFQNGTLLLVDPEEGNRTAVVSHYVSVNSSEHIVTLVARPHLQSTWSCRNHLVDQPSNSFDIVMETGAPVTTVSPLAGSPNTDTNVLYIAIGCSVVVVVLAAVILVVAVQRKRKSNTLEEQNKAVAESSTGSSRGDKIEMMDNILYESGAMDKDQDGDEKVMMENTLYVGADEDDSPTTAV
ncbi:uncharacterized protein LOC124292425 [Haliotis rubra]|uniref:uncharacterized protein LOC124292425 n=1 Tax=Haliotis rubra TaxID=36100 RepID=UPI001EE51064|nr:uncharacterized protein LOC124292425 [Haliotis rubra]